MSIQIAKPLYLQQNLLPSVPPAPHSQGSRRAACFPFRKERVKNLLELSIHRNIPMQPQEPMQHSLLVRASLVWEDPEGSALSTAPLRLKKVWTHRGKAWGQCSPESSHQCDMNEKSWTDPCNVLEWRLASSSTHQVGTIQLLQHPITQQFGSTDTISFLYVKRILSKENTDILRKRKEVL